MELKSQKLLKEENSKCVDIDECSSNSHDCPVNSLCENKGEFKNFTELKQV